MLTEGNLELSTDGSKTQKFITQISLFKIDLLLFISAVHMAGKWLKCQNETALIFRGGHQLITQTQV